MCSAPPKGALVRSLSQYLEERCELAPTLPTTTERRVADYGRYLDRVRGLCAGTIKMHAATITGFLRFLDHDVRPQQLRELRAADVEAFVARAGGQVGRRRMGQVTVALRTFLRFLAATGEGPAGLDAQVESPRIYRSERLPRALAWETVRTFLRSIDRTTSKGRRDYAMFVLVATYGLRASEVRALDLDDLWARLGAAVCASTAYFRRSQETENPAALVTAHYMLGTVLVYLGEIGSAREHYAQGIALSDTHRDLALPDGRDPGVACRAQMARVLWLCGYPEQAIEVSETAQEAAQGHPHDLAFAFFLDMLVRQFRREIGLTEQRAERLKELADDHRLPHYRAWAGILHGWARAASEPTGGIAEMRENLAAYERLGNELSRPHFLALLAEALGAAGRGEEGLAAIGEAFESVERTNERYYEAELHRLNGELLLPRSASDQQQAEAEACFHRALDVARRQQAKSFELRAATSLARLWLRQGRGADARTVLASVYDRFTEGFELADLGDAKALLDEATGPN
ncbi:MAG: site-specific integrase [Acidobacteria bacterium]|nr:site-specific integrase [Acidobacteriota bacterium]